jgi:hypothetical protein
MDHRGIIGDVHIGQFYWSGYRTDPDNCSRQSIHN